MKKQKTDRDRERNRKKRGRDVRHGNVETKREKSVKKIEKLI